MSIRNSSRMESLFRIIMTIVVLFNAAVPAAALALPPSTNEDILSQQPAEKENFSAQVPVYSGPDIALSDQAQLSPNAEEAAPRSPKKDPIEFSISSTNGEVETDRSITINVVIRNHSEEEIKNLTYYDKLEDGFSYHFASSDAVSYNLLSGTVRNNLGTLEVGGEASFSYVLDVGDPKINKLLIHNAEIEYDLTNGETRAQTTSMGVADNSSLVGENALIILPDQVGDGWDSAGRYSLYLNDKVLTEEAVVSVAPTNVSGNNDNPEWQFNIDLIQTSTRTVTPGGELAEQDISLSTKIESDFDSPAYLEINLDELVDLNNIPAGLQPYVATYDEARAIWVKVPIIATDLAANSVTVEAPHFSTWGVGLGSSLPQNGANVLLFDQPYASLFTGSARHSIPLWTPPGRAGLAPDVSLSYSSATVDGVLGDVQAPWVGVGWNIDSAEIVRKITTSETGYGYENSFTLSINGTSYELMVDPNNQSRYYTKRASFLYIERHNPALGNANGTDSAPNDTKEWWELITTDGTSYRFGWNKNSEQLALMYGYQCTNLSACPDGAYASSGYAGNAKDRVALRWRVDRVVDTNNNYMEYAYQEDQTAATASTPRFDRASYLQTIKYNGNVAEGLLPKYVVQFNLEDRIGDGKPLEFNLWDNFDLKELKEILVCFEACPTSGQSSENLIRKYEFDYEKATVPNSNGTLTLSRLGITGGDFQDGTNGTEAIPLTNSATMLFTYENKPNRAVTGGAKEYAYPRLSKIENGLGGSLAYVYENDGRGSTSWYNYRVKIATASAGTNAASIHGYTYTTPVYAYSNNTGALTGYSNTVEAVFDFNGTTKLSETSHQFGTLGLDIGNEAWVENRDATGIVLQKEINTYITDNSAAPFPGWNYRYLLQTQNYVRYNGSLIAISKTTYNRDPRNGNLLLKRDYVGSSLARREIFEYSTVPAHLVANMTGKVIHRTLVNGADGKYLSEVYFDYDSHGNLTRQQNVAFYDSSAVAQTSDVQYAYDGYGNMTTTMAYKAYGTVGNPNDTLGHLQTSTTYDAVLHLYPVTVTTPLGQTTTDFLIKLGLPYKNTDVNSWQITTTYDGLGRMLSSTPAGLPSAGVKYEYPEVVNESVSSPYEITMQIYDQTIEGYRNVVGVYDGLGRILKTRTYSDGNSTSLLLTTENVYNAQGLIVQQSLPYGPSDPIQYTTTSYDALGRPTSITAPGNITTSTAYDGLRTTVTDPNGNKVSRTTDGLGRLAYVQEYQGNTQYATTQYKYDGADRLIRVVDAQANMTVMEYDLLGRKKLMDDPDMGEWTYQYNALGGMTEQKDANQNTTTFDYDTLNRLSSKTAGAVTTTYEYGSTTNLGPANNLGMRTGMTTATAQQGMTFINTESQWTYGNYGRVVTEQKTIGGVAKTLTTSTDWLGRPLSITYPDDEVLTYGYDALGRPDNLKSGNNTLVDLVYNSLGQVTQTTLGNSNQVTILNQYNSSTNRLQSRTAKNSSNNPLMGFSYEYDSAGNIKKIQDTFLGETLLYTYDSLNRLLTADAVKGSTYGYRSTYDYDQVGNILAVNDWKTSDVLIKDDFEESPVMIRAEDQNTWTGWSLLEDDMADIWPEEKSSFPSVLGNYSLVVDVNDNSPIYLLRSFSTAEARVRARFYFHPSSLNLGSGEVMSVVTGFSLVSGVEIPSFKLELQKTGSTYQVRMNALSDSGNWTNPSNWQSISSNQWSAIELDYQAASAGGSTSVWINGGTPQITTGIDNATRTITSVEVGAMDVDGGTRGQFFIDAFEARRNTYIGLLTQQTAAVDNSSNISSAVLFDPQSAYSIYPASWNNQEADTPTPSFTPIPSDTPTPTSTATSTRTLIPTFTNSPTITYTPSITPTITKTPTRTWTPTISRTPSPTASATMVRSNTPITNTATPTATPVGAPNLVAYWSFDDISGTTVPDQMAPVSNGTISGGAEPVPGYISGLNTPQPSTGALRFGSGQFVTVLDHAKLKPTLGFSMSVWVFPTQVNQGTQYTILNKAVTNEDYRLYINSDGYLVFKINDLTPNEVKGPKLMINEWTQVAATYDQVGGVIRLYVNGNPVASRVVTGTITYATGNLTFNSSSNPFIGILDEVRFYSGVLSDQDVSLLPYLVNSTPYPTFTPSNTPQPTPITSTWTPSRTPTISKTPTITMTPASTNTLITPVVIEAGDEVWGTGYDGDLVVPTAATGVSGTFNINTDHVGNRACADAPVYSLSALGNTSATINTDTSYPLADCLHVDDEILLINMQGNTSYYGNTGNYEFLKIQSIDTSSDPNHPIIYFTSSKINWYGAGFRSDSNIGSAAGQQRVIVMRVPNYQDVDVDGIVTAKAWDGTKYGVLMFRVRGTLSGGTAAEITMTGNGYRTDETYVGIVEGYGAGGKGNVGASGAGGGYGANGTASNSGTAGIAYGNAPLSQIFPGSGGGSSGGYNKQEMCGGGSGPLIPCTVWYAGPSGGSGGGILMFSSQTMNFAGTVASDGDKGGSMAEVYVMGGGASGGSVLVHLGTMSASPENINALGGDAGGSGAGPGGVGRIAVKYEVTPVITGEPAAYLSQFGALVTPTIAPTATAIDWVAPWGTQRDGDLTVAAGTTFNLSTQNSSLHTCNDGGDGVSYSVIQLEASWAKLSATPSPGCLKAGDEFLLMNMNGTSAHPVNVGNYEFLHVSAVADDMIYFSTPKTKFYGDNINDDTNIGISSPLGPAVQQRVILQRVPNYRTVEINGTLTVTAWDGLKNGVIVFRAETFQGSGDGVVNANALGYAGNTGYAGLGSYYTNAGIMYGGGQPGGDAPNSHKAGGGGGYGSDGSYSGAALAGLAYGNSKLDILFPGGGGGGGGYCANCGTQEGGSPGKGGGIIYILAETINFPGDLKSEGSNGSVSGGAGGAGGSIRIEGENINLGSASVTGGLGANSSTGNQGGFGRTAVYYHGEALPTLGFTPDYLQKNDIPDSLFSYDFETGNITGTATSIPGWSSPNGSPAVNGSADYAGNYGMQVQITSTAEVSVVYNTPQDEPSYRARFYVNPNSVTMGADILDLFNGYNGTTRVFTVQMQKAASYQIRAGTLNDAGAWTYTSWYDISNTWTGIEVDYHALRTSGSLELMLNGTSKQKITGVDNDTRALTQFRLGAQGVGVNTNGVIYFDEFVSRRFTPIGLLLEADVPMGSPSTQAGWQARTYHYEGAQAHAVTSLTDNTGTPGEYSYDDNGNMTCRVEDGIIYKQVYNAENRISSIMKLAEGTCTSVVKLSMQWDFAYDGDGVRTVTLTTPYDAEGVPQTASLTSYYFGGAYETRSDGSIFKYYTFGGQSIVNEKSAATNNEWKLSYLLTDHLGSVVAVTNGTGALISKQRYLPFGGERTNIGTISQTDYGYTGQREIDKVGLIDYKARFYSSYITQFSQPDSIVPDLYNPQAFNRYSYVLNNPVRYNDPTGHQIACGAELSVKECKTERKLSKISTAGQWKKLIHDDLGITMSDDKHNWDTNNLEIVYFGLAQIDNIFGGKTKSFAEGSVFLLDGKPIGQYSGFTTGRTIIFYTGSTIPFQNLYHEFGHLLDNIFKDSFTNQLKREPHYADGGAYLFGGDSVGIINSNATLKNSSRVGDPNWPYGIASLQHPSGDPVEQWGDMFANYVAGNIDLTKSGGQDMFNTVDGYLKNAGLIP